MPRLTTLFFNDPADGWVEKELYSIDAAEAVAVDPANWRMEKPVDAGDLPALPKAAKKDSGEK